MGFGLMLPGAACLSSAGRAIVTARASGSNSKKFSNRREPFCSGRVSAEIRVYMKSHVSLLGALLLACLAAFTASVVMVLLAAGAEESLREQSLKSREVLAELSQLQTQALEAETGQRGYLLTGEDVYYQGYQSGVENLQARLGTYEALIAPRISPSQQENLAALKRVSEAKTAELAQTIQLFRTGDAQGALELVRTNSGAALMAELQAVTAQLVAEEETILATSRAKALEMRKMRAWAMSLLAALALAGFGLAYRNLRRAQKLDRVEQHALELADEREPTDLLARELSHRVKNLFSIVQSIISATARQETDVRVAAAKIRERVHALSRAHSLTTSLDLQQQTSVEELIAMIVAAQATGTSTLTAEGPPVIVTAQHVTPLGMILHELTTNAVKYGAWSADGGHINVNWAVGDTGKGREMTLKWQEICVAHANRGPVGEDGFGSRMINLSLAQLCGKSVRDWNPAGLQISLVLPIDNHGALKGRNAPED